MFPNYDGALVSPQTIEDFATAGLFTVLYEGNCPTAADLA
jgi:hypothetical protein